LGPIRVRLAATWRGPVKPGETPNRPDLLIPGPNPGGDSRPGATERAACLANERRALSSGTQSLTGSHRPWYLDPATGARGVGGWKRSIGEADQGRRAKRGRPAPQSGAITRRSATTPAYTSRSMSASRASSPSGDDAPLVHGVDHLRWPQSFGEGPEPDDELVLGNVGRTDLAATLPSAGATLTGREQLSHIHPKGLNSTTSKGGGKSLQQRPRGSIIAGPEATRGVSWPETTAEAISFSFLQRSDI